MHGPQRGHHARDAGLHEAAREADDALAAYLTPERGPAGRQDHQVGGEVEVVDLGEAQETVERLETLPPQVLAPERRRRAYLNAVLARAEVASAYQPARKLWVRERRGEYVLDPALAIREIDERGDESWRPLPLHLGHDLLERHVAPPPRYRARA